MSQLTAAELNPLVHGLETMTDESTPAGSEISHAVTIDWDGGKVDLDGDALKRNADECLPAEVSDSFVSASKGVLRGGVAVFKDDPPPPELLMEIDPDSEPSVESVLHAVPWVVISDLVQSFRGTPEGLRGALGINGATTGEEAARAIRASFPNAPDWMLEGRAADLFARDPEANPFALSNGVQEGYSFPRPEGAIVPPVQTAGASDYYDIAMGIVKGDWNGLGDHWWGWPFGWSVGIKGNTADALANLLLGTNGGGKLFDALYQAVKAHGISAGTKALSITAGTAIALYAVALGLNIKAVNGKKGVRLQGNWPVIGGPGAFVWATKG
jgi:hypothetical protein